MPTNTKLPDLPELDVIDDADLLYVVDTSDTTDSAEGSSKWIPWSLLYQTILDMVVSGVPGGNTDNLVMIAADDSIADSGIGVIDEDNMASDSDVHLPTQQSVKAYVDAEIAAIPPAVGGATYLLEPANADLPDTNFASLGKISGTNHVYKTLDFDPGTDETAYWTVVIPTDLTPASGKLVIYWGASAGTPGQVAYLDVTTRSPNDDEVVDATTTPSQNANTGHTDVLLATGDAHKIEITLTITGWAAGDLLTIKLTRDANHGSDNLSGDFKFIRAILQIR